MLIAFPFIAIASIFGVNGGNLIYIICKYWTKIWYISIAMFHKEIYEFPHDRTKQYIFIGNHISYMDIPALVLAIHQPFRALGKYEMVKMPIFGWIYKAAVIQVNRSDSQHRAKSVRALKAVLKRGISIFIFPEGKINETSEILLPFFDGAFKIAIETQTNIKPILFVDTLERLHFKNIFSLCPGKNRVVYLAEINVQGLTMKDLVKVRALSFSIIENGLKKYRKY